MNSLKLSRLTMFLVAVVGTFSSEIALERIGDHKGSRLRNLKYLPSICQITPWQLIEAAVKA